MKRLAFCLVLLCFPGCMLADEYVLEESVWYDVVVDECGVCHMAAPAAPVQAAPAPRVAPSPQVVPLGQHIIPAGGALPSPPAAPQTREPELLTK